MDDNDGKSVRAEAAVATSVAKANRYRKTDRSNYDREVFTLQNICIGIAIIDNHDKLIMSQQQKRRHHWRGNDNRLTSILVTSPMRRLIHIAFAIRIRLQRIRVLGSPVFHRAPAAVRVSRTRALIAGVVHRTIRDGQPEPEEKRQTKRQNRSTKYQNME